MNNLKLMAAMCLNKLEQWQQKAGKVSGTNMEELEEHLVTNEIN